VSKGVSVMAVTNPYQMIKDLNKMPTVLQQELIGDNENTSLEKVQPYDNRDPLMDAYIDNRLRSDKPITFLGFIDDLRKLWTAAGHKAPIIRQHPSDQDAKFPSITYRMVRRVVNGEFKDLKPRHRSTIKHPYIDGEYVELYGQIFDVWVEFCIFSLSAEEADELVIEFEEFLQTYAGYFKRNGVQEIAFHSQGEDEVTKEARVDASKRKLNYTMRFEKIIVRFLNEIQQIAVQANLHHEGEKQSREDS
jgi:hypothetical protein